MKPRNLRFWLNRQLAAAFPLELLGATALLGQVGPPVPPGLAQPSQVAAARALPPPITVPVPQVLAGHVPPQVGALGLSPVGTLDPAQQLRLAVALPLQHQQELGELLGQLYDPESPVHGRFLTVQEFAQGFGPPESDYLALAAFVQANNLQVTATYPDRTLLDVSGSVADIERVFNVRLLLYNHPFEPRQFHAPDAEPSVDLPVPLLHISGLND
jgi:hypothetical protein